MKPIIYKSIRSFNNTLPKPTAAVDQYPLKSKELLDCHTSCVSFGGNSPTSVATSSFLLVILQPVLQ